MKLNQFVIALLLVAVSSTYATHHIIKPQDSTNGKDDKKKSKKGNKSNKEEAAVAATIEVSSDQIAATAGELDLSEFDEKNFERAPSIIVQLLSTLPMTSFQNENFGVSKSFVGVDEEGCVMNLVKSGDSVVGSVVCEKTNKIYDIAHLNGKYVITEHSGNDYPDEEVVPLPPNQGSRRNTIVSGHSWANSNDNTTNMLLKEGADHDHGRNLGGQAVIENGKVVIDVMVLYTSKAKCEVANKKSNCPVSPIEQKIDLALTETNNAYAMSGVDITLKLVHSQEVQTSDFQESSDSFSNGLDFMYENISNNKKPLKDLHGADLVALIVGSGRSCGMAYQNQPNYEQKSMVSVTSQSCMTGYFSFGHEIGHNMGLNHDRRVTDTCNTDKSSSNYGYRDPSANFRSIMSYDCNSGSKCCSGDTCNRSCVRVQRFSNTEIKYAGKKIGTWKSNNAKWLNNVAPQVSALNDRPFQAPPSSPAPIALPTSMPISTPTSSGEKYWIACGTIGHSKCDNNAGVNEDITGPAKAVDKGEKHFVRCCSDISKTGYTNRYCPEVWTGSYLGIDDSCSGALTFTEASSFCSNANGRLCTKGELMNNCARGTGCSYDKELVWTKTADTPLASTPIPASSPTFVPTAKPTLSPTSAPTPSPTSSPTFATTTQPISSPTSSPTSAPTPSPTSSPTFATTTKPISSPTSKKSKNRRQR